MLKESISESFMSLAQKKMIASYVREMGSLYAYCYDVAVEKMGEKIGNNTVAIKDIATTLFLSAVRKYNLQ